MRDLRQRRRPRPGHRDRRGRRLRRTPRGPGGWRTCRSRRTPAASNSAELPITPAQVAQVIALVDDGKLNNKVARQVVDHVLDGEGDPEQVVAAIPSWSSYATTPQLQGRGRRGAGREPRHRREDPRRQGRGRGQDRRRRHEGHPWPGRPGPGQGTGHRGLRLNPFCTNGTFVRINRTSVPFVSTGRAVSRIRRRRTAGAS